MAYSGAELEKIFLFAGLLLLRSAGNSILNYFASRLLRDSYSSLMKELKYDLTENILRVRTACMDEKGSGVFTQRLINETTNIADLLDEVLAASTDLFRLVSLGVAFAVISVKMLAFETVLIMITHRLSTVINCKHLFLIKDGKVLAEGTHKELPEKCEDYRTLYREECTE